MKKLFKLSILIFIFLVTVFPVVSIASSRGSVISSTSIVDYKIISQDNNKMVIGFKITNGQGVQSGIRYGLKLIKEVNKSQYVVDEKTYDDIVTLAENTNIKKEVVYEAPSNLDGDYSLYLTTRNDSGMMFGMGLVGKIKLISTNKGIEILSETCNLTISNSKSKKTYNLIEGVDISKDENLQLNCKAYNKGNKDIIATPFFETHFRTIYGEIVGSNTVDNPPVSFKIGEKKDVSILLPKALSPQAYDIKVVFLYNNEKSNTIIAHYVIQGVSATIQNLSLDKDFYEKGDTAKMFFSWTPSADSFPESRIGKGTSIGEVYVQGDITNKLGLKCVDSIKQLLPTDINTLKNEIPLFVKRTCVDPKISVSIVDKDGQVLDQKDFSIETTTRQKTTNYTLISILVGLIILTIVIFVLYFKNKKNPKSDINIPIAIFILIFTLVSFNIPIFHTNATQIAIDAVEETGGEETGGAGGGVVVITPTGGTGVVPEGLSATLTINKYSYDPNTPVVITTSVYYPGCSNATRNIVATGYISGPDDYVSSIQNLFTTDIEGRTSIAQDVEFTAPPTKGDYILHMDVDGYVVNFYIYENGVNTNISATSLTYIKEKLKSLILSDYSDYFSGLEQPISSAGTLGEINDYLETASLSNIYIVKTTGGLDFTRGFEASPLRVMGVDTKLCDSCVSPINYDSGTQIQWYPTNATRCTCTYLDASGASQSCLPGGAVETTDFKNDQWNLSAPIPNLTKTTTFKVHCD